MMNDVLLQADSCIENLPPRSCIDYAKELTRHFMAYAHAIDECVVSQQTRNKIVDLARDLLKTQEKIPQ